MVFFRLNYRNCISILSTQSLICILKLVKRKLIIWISLTRCVRGSPKTRPARVWPIRSMHGHLSHGRTPLWLVWPDCIAHMLPPQSSGPTTHAPIVAHTPPLGPYGPGPSRHVDSNCQCVAWWGLSTCPTWWPNHSHTRGRAYTVQVQLIGLTTRVPYPG